MNFEFASKTLGQMVSDKTDVLVVLVPDGFKPQRDGLSKLIGDALKTEALESKAGKTLSSWRSPEVAAQRLVLAGIGDGSPTQVRTGVAAAMAIVKSTGSKRLSLCFPTACTGDALRVAALAVADGCYAYTTTKSRPEGRKLTEVVISVPGAALSEDLRHAKAVISGIELAKEWANRPANHATPTKLARAAHALAGGKIECTVHGPKKVAKLGMGAFLAVAQGSDEPLQFIELRYTGAARDEAPVVLIGKGITFDTGGISIKPAPEMDEMKFDMCGAASVLGVFQALAELKPKVNVVGLIPACENMPGGRAVKPGDVVTSMSGQTIEILNTDAEGRLVLCDALAYASRFKPRAVVDIATLTGACVIALGGVRSGLFSNDEELANALITAGESSLDLCWRLPLDEEYGEGLKTNFADLANVAGRAGGAVTAAKFLQRFATGMQWAHLDIAGTAWKGGAAKGATGRPVGLLVNYLCAVQTEKPADRAVRAKRSRAGASVAHAGKAGSSR
ncbi:MAG TPA: leucyl aminopeptidase [Burkholderiaceae bacterium]|nr:leucyl aminopeptidase [Burkholderiaceae bacterium]